ncbi:MAG: hypothetical protein R2801_11310 [Chitinophagales bacterium]
MIIVIAFVWLGVHHYLVKNNNVNPWKLGGLAMYTNLHDLNMDIRFYKDRQELKFSQDDLSEKSVKTVNKYYNRKSSIGDLASNNRLIKTLANETHADSIVITLEFVKIDYHTKKITKQKEISVWQQDN